MQLSHRPCCGLLQSHYYIPTRHAPIQMEFQIVSNANEPIVVPQVLIKLIKKDIILEMVILLHSGVWWI